MEKLIFRTNKHDIADRIDNHNETVFLDCGTNKGVFLQGIKDEKQVEIKIFEDSFIIGRFKPQVDLVLESRFVSKVHSEIIFRDENYYIKDINSQNGTFINSLRIDSNKEYKIKNGDKIVFADSEFIFFDKDAKRIEAEVLCQ